MSDTSLVFNILGRDSTSKVLNVIRNAFRSTGATAEASLKKATKPTEQLERDLDKAQRKIEQLGAATAKNGVAMEAAQLRLAAAQQRLNALNEKVGATEAQKAMALNRVKAAELGVADAAAKANRIQGERQKAVAETERLKDALLRAEEGSDSLGDSGGRTGGVLSRLGGWASQAGSSLAGMGSSTVGLASSIGGLIAIVLGLAAALASIGPAVAIAGGVLGSLPGLIGGAAAGMGTLKLGLFGLGDEYKRLTTATGGGGGGATKAAKDFTAANRAVEQAVKAVARAERDVRDAQQAALDAQRAINAARETASDRLRDQALDLRGALLDQKDAAVELDEAQAALNVAKAIGNTENIAKAQAAYDRVKLSVDQVNARIDDLKQANDENMKAGVEGSQEVVQAKDRERQAVQRVKDAQEAQIEATQRLADAQKALADQQKAGAAGGGGGGAGQQITKLAPAARAFLNTILGLRPAFESLRLDVQEKLFAGLGDKVQTLAERWLPQLHTTLGNFATTFNGIASTFFTSASKKTFIENMATGAESARRALREIGGAVAGPLVDAFGRLARASGPFVERLGTLIARTVTKFSEWIRKADESGKLTRFFKGAADTLEKVWTVTGRVVEVVGKFVSIIFGPAKSGGDSVLDGANMSLEKISAWLDRPENKQKILDIVHGIRDIVTAVGSAGESVARFVSSASRAWTGLKNGLTSAYNWVVSKGGQLVNWVKALPSRITRSAAGMWDGIKASFRGAINWVIGRWNNLRFSLPSVTLPLIGTIGGATLDTPNIPYLAKGGDVTRAGMAVVGDRGPELLTLPRGAQVTPLRGAAAGGRQTLQLEVVGDREAVAFVRKMIRTANLLQA